MPRVPLPRPSVILCLAACALIAGCQRQRWTSSSVKGNEFEVQAVQLNGKNVFVIATTGTVAGGFEGGPEPHGTFQPPQRPKVDWYYNPLDLENGVFTIGDQQYDVGPGTIFLVSLGSDPLQVEQVTADISRVHSPNTLKGLREIGKTEPRVNAFLVGME